MNTQGPTQTMPVRSAGTAGWEPWPYPRQVGVGGGGWDTGVGDPPSTLQGICSHSCFQNGKMCSLIHKIKHYTFAESKCHPQR